MTQRMSHKPTSRLAWRTERKDKHPLERVGILDSAEHATDQFGLIFKRELSKEQQSATPRPHEWTRRANVEAHGTAETTGDTSFSSVSRWATRLQHDPHVESR